MFAGHRGGQPCLIRISRVKVDDEIVVQGNSLHAGHGSLGHSGFINTGIVFQQGDRIADIERFSSRRHRHTDFAVADICLNPIGQGQQDISIPDGPRQYELQVLEATDILGAQTS